MNFKQKALLEYNDEQQSIMTTKHYINNRPLWWTDHYI